MTRLRVLLSRLLGPARRGRAERELSEEIETHLQLLTDEYIARGLSASEARLAARRAFGGVDQVRMQYLEQRGWPWLDELAQDLRFGFRMAAASPGFTAAVVGALGLGIGVATTIFTILYGMNLRPLPFPDPAQIVGVRVVDPRGRPVLITYDLYTAWSAADTGLQALAASHDESMNLGDDDRLPERYSGAYITANTFGMLGVAPVLGRNFREDDDRPGAAPVTILGHRVWSGRYESRVDVVGRTVRINGIPTTVVGVMPRDFHFPFQADLWQPLRAMPAMRAGAGERPGVALVGRLAEGMPVEHIQAALTGIGAAEGYGPDAEPARRYRFVVRPLNDIYFSHDQGIPVLLIGAVVVVMIIACANAANLLLARAAARGREVALRAALGAGRARIVRQLLVEGCVLAIPACGLGLAGAVAGVTLFRREVADLALLSMPYWTRFAFDGHVFAFVALSGVSTALLASVAPALHLARGGGALLVTSRTATPPARRMTAAFLVVQFALTLTLLGAAAVLVQSARALSHADRIVAMERIWTARVALPRGRYGAPASRQAFYSALETQLARLPAVAAATVASAFPFAGTDERLVSIAGTAVEPERWPAAAVVAIDPHYFDTLGLGVLAGRPFSPADGPAAVAIVNERLARLHAGDADPVGLTLQLFDPRSPDAPVETRTIVGVAPSVRQGPMDDAQPVVYRPFAGADAAQAVLMVREVDAGAGSIAAVRAAVRALDPDLPLFNVSTLERISEYSRWAHRVVSAILAVFAGVAVLLAAAGLYGVAAHGVIRRTQEIAVRLALGAGTGRIARLFLWSTTRLVVVGLVIGLAGAVAAGTAVSGLLIRATITDPAVLIGISLLLAGAAFAALLGPLVRAVRVDPAAALRHD